MRVRLKSCAIVTVDLHDNFRMNRRAWVADPACPVCASAPARTTAAADAAPAGTAAAGAAPADAAPAAGVELAPAAP